ncbi:MAG: single-stranded-DNA-specific exonuclease RecJ [Eubacteriales bacterium]
MKLKPRYQKDIDKVIIDMLSNELSVSKLTAEILFMRGYTSADDAKEYLGLNGVKFSNPYDIAGMQEAIDKINEAMMKDQHITIYSDYDADGVCGCSIFLKKFKELNYSNVSYYVPQREGEGYGLNRDALDKIQNNGTELVITVDCGISNLEEVSHANSIGLDIIITDHHNCPPDLPDCILVNPKLGCANGQENLCGAAVAMKVCQALGGGSAFNEGMELAAIATVADMMPLLGENKHIVNQGLDLINNRPSPEIKSFVKAAVNKEMIDSEDIAFKLGPIINAAGRISTAHIGVELLSGRTNTPLEDSLSMIAQNEERKEIQSTVYKEALKMLSTDDLRNQKAIVLYKESWPIGVVGIAASKLMNTFGRPIALLGKSEGKIKGSLRSVEGINIFDILYEMNELFDSFGGHSKAAGITLKNGMYDEFKRRFQKAISEYDKSLFDNTMYYDAVCNANEVNMDFINELSYMKPFGQDNPAVSILMKNMIVSSYKTMGKDSNHYSAIFKDFSGQIKCTGFFSTLSDALSRGDMLCDILIEPSENIWNGYSSIQGMMQGIKARFNSADDFRKYLDSISDGFTASSVQAALMDGEGKFTSAEYSDIASSLSESDYSTLIIAEDKSSAEKIIDNLGFDVISKLNISTNVLDFSTTGKNTLLLAPELEKLKSKWYSHIFYVSSHKSTHVVKTLSKLLHHNIQMVIMDSIYKDRLITKERLREIYSLIKRAVSRDSSINPLDKCDILGIKRYEMIIAIDAFKESGLLEEAENVYIMGSETKKEIETTKAYILFS